MAIQSVNSGNVNNSVPQTKSTNKNAATPQKEVLAPIANTDTVSITHGANNTRDFDSSVSGVDKARVEAIKTALKSGDYKIDPERVASKMMQFDQELLTDTT